MANTVADFMTTKDVRKTLKLGNKACLALFHRADFPCVKFGKSFLVSVDAFNKYMSKRRVKNEGENS